MTLNKFSQIGNLRHLGTQIDDLFPFLLEGSRKRSSFLSLCSWLQNVCVCIWRRSCTILYLSYLWYLHYVHAMTKIRSEAIVVGHQLCVAANICCLEGGEFHLESCKRLTDAVGVPANSMMSSRTAWTWARQNQLGRSHEEEWISIGLRRMEKMLPSFLSDAFRSGMVVDPDRCDLESKDDGPMVLLVVQNWDLLYFMMGRWPKYDLNW